MSMKNLFLLPTTPNDETAGGIWIPKTRDWCNIYITSDEEIKDGDYVLYHEDKISQVLGINIDELKLDKGGVWRSSCKKIILTTDQELIADGVQAIDDEFLEWFVKNPSCEEIEVDCWTVRTKDKVVYEPPLKEYEIIISQKEFKEKTNDSSLKLLQVMELVELALQNGSIHPDSFIIRNAVRECIGLEPIK